MASSQVSAVQGTPSLQRTVTPGMQPIPATQDSSPLQNDPSSHARSSVTCRHVALASSQTSTVHPMPSPHGGGVPATQPVPVTHASLPLQLPSAVAPAYVHRDPVTRA